MSSDDWAGSTRGGILWSTLAFIGSRGVTVVTTIILARLLAPDQFGLLAAVIVYLTLVELAGGMGMNATVIYEQQSGVTKRVHVAFTLNLIVAVLLTGLGVLLAPLVAALFELQDHVDLFRLGALGLLLNAFGNIPDALLMREMEFRRRSIPQLARAGARGVVSIALVLAGLEAAGLVIGMLAGTAVWSVTALAMTGYRPKLTLDREVVRGLVAYGSGAVVLEVIAVVAGRIDQIAISRVLGQSALGLYSVAFRVPEMLIDSVSWNVSQVAFPALSRKRVADERGLGAATTSLLRYLALYALPVATGLAVLATPLVVVLFGPVWEEAGSVMSAVAVVSGITAVVFPLGDVFKAIGRQRTLVGLNLFQIPFYVAAIIAAAPHGIVAVAWARAGTVVVARVIMMGFVMRATRIGVREVASALRGPVAAAAGVGLGAGIVRFVWPDPSVGPLLLGSLAALAGGLAALRLAAPATLREIRGWVEVARARARPARAGA
jgi:PST family polysaccharide transporter